MVIAPLAPQARSLIANHWQSCGETGVTMGRPLVLTAALVQCRPPIAGRNSRSRGHRVVRHQQVTMTAGFIDKHGLWTETQRHQAAELKRRLDQEDLKLVRLAWADPHGYSRAKAVTIPAFLSALATGYNINVATTTLDSAGTRTFSSFTRGGGMGLDEMTGSPNLTIVPDPGTFRVLPWAPGVGWVLCDEYFNSGVPFHFSSRHLLRRQLRRLEDKGMGFVVGLEVAWYLLRVVQDQLGAENIGAPRARGCPLKTAPPQPGYSHQSE